MSSPDINTIISNNLDLEHKELKTLINLERTAFTLHKCHSHKAYLCKVYNEFTVISTIIVSSFITIFIPLIYNYEGDDSKSAQIVNAVLGFYITFITSLSRFYKPSEFFQIYKTFSREYLSLKYNIRRRIISFEQHGDIDSITKSIEELENLRQEAPFINDKLYNSFY